MKIYRLLWKWKEKQNLVIDIVHLQFYFFRFAKIVIKNFCTAVHCLIWLAINTVVSRNRIINSVIALLSTVCLLDLPYQWRWKALDSTLPSQVLPWTGSVPVRKVQIIDKLFGFPLICCTINLFEKFYHMKTILTLFWIWFTQYFTVYPLQPFLAATFSSNVLSSKESNDFVVAFCSSQTVPTKKEYDMKEQDCRQ